MNLAPRAAMQHMIFVFQSPKLKSRLEDAKKLDRTDLKNAYFKFIRFLGERADIFEDVLSIIAGTKNYARREDFTKQGNIVHQKEGDNKLKNSFFIEPEQGYNEKHYIKDDFGIFNLVAKPFVEEY